MFNIFSAAVITQGGLWMWGKGRQCGDGNTASKLVPTLVCAEAFEGSPIEMVACGGLHSLAVTPCGALWAWGYGADGQLGQGDRKHHRTPRRVGTQEFGGRKILTAVAGGKHSAAVTEDGRLWAWGILEGVLFSDPVSEPKEVSLRGARVAQWARMPEDHALAFAMGTHVRLGGVKAAEDLEVQEVAREGYGEAGAVGASGQRADCPHVDLPEHLVQMVLQTAFSWPTTFGSGEMMERLFGGGVIWGRRPESEDAAESPRAWLDGRARCRIS